MITYRGRENKPAAVFIHGLGMDADIWVNPSASRVLGGRFPVGTLLSKRPTVEDFGLCTRPPGKAARGFSTGRGPDTLNTLFGDLGARGYTVITWSQKRPAGPIDSILPELREAVRVARTMTRSGIILIGHSRGGLVARKYLANSDKSVRALITISTPHIGSSVAKIAAYLSPLVSVIDPLFPGGDKGTLSFAVKRIFGFLKSRALKELLPGSKFLRSMKDRAPDWIHYISVGGTNPTLFSLYRWRWFSVREGDCYRWFLRPVELFSIPDIFEKVIPENFYPEEMKKGAGDGLVSAKSSRIPWGNEHYNFDLNHAEVLFDEGVRNTLLKAIERID
jgi:pimeloyl-ACP methyl ester carboxylesterase